MSYRPHLVLLALMIVWGSSYSGVKVALESMQPISLVAVRFGLGAIVLAMLLGRRAGADLRATFRPGMITGVALAAGFVLQTFGLRETSASMGGFLAGLIVLLVAVGGVIFFRARMGTQSVGGLVLGLAGLVLLCWPVEAAGHVVDTPRGILLQVGSTICFAGHILMLSHFGRGAPAIAYSFWQLVLTTVVAAGAALLDGEGGAATSIEWSGQLVFVVLYLGVLASGISIAIQSKVQHRIPPTHIALLFATQPLFAAIIGFVVLGDRMGATQWLGGVTIVAGVLITSLDPKSRVASSI